jgi:transposase-like protein
MKHYSQKRKDAVLKRMMQPENAPVPMLAEETGISKVTLYDWRKHAIAKGLVVPEDTQNPENWSAEYKFTVVLETAVMNQAELSEYCRKKGLFAEQITAWKENCLQGNAAVVNQSKEEKRQAQLVRNEVKQLKRELRRKDQALAETAALLVLRKKMHAIWGEDEDE